MPAQTPSGIVSLPMTKLADLLANSATFQDIVGATTAANALERIHYFEASDEETEENSGQLIHPRSRAIIDGLPRNWERRRDGAGEWSGTAGLVLSLELSLPSEYSDSPKEEAIWFGNKLGAIVSEMEVLTESGLYYDMQRISAINGPGPPVVDDEIVDYSWWGVVFMVEGRN